MFSYKFRVYPSKDTALNLNGQLELCRWLYNRLLEELNRARESGQKLTMIDTQSLIPRLKGEKPELKTVYSKPLQMVNYQLWSNVKALGRLKERGRRVGKLRFKKSFRTMNFNQSGFSIDEQRGKLKLSKVGEVPIKLHREVRGKVKAVIVKRESSGKWFAILQVEDVEEPEPLPPTGSVVGVDVGVKHFLTDSNGNQIENPRFYEKTLDRIAKLQKKLSRKVRGSSNWYKVRTKLARAYERLVNQRNDFLHKLSRYFVDSHGLIAVEDLNISGMSRSKLSLKILDTSWGKFLSMLSYKAERAGRRVVKVPPHYTSQQNKHIKDRDFRASLNILNKCLSGSGRPSVPVEERPLLRIPAKAVVTGQASLKKQEAAVL